MTRLESLIERQAKLEREIKAEKEKEAALKVLQGIQGEVGDAIRKAVEAKGMDIAALDGKYFALTVGDGGLEVSLVNKVKGNGASRASGNGNGNYEYFLKDGRGPFATVQEALDAMALPADKRPAHNRWERLAKDLKGQVERREKANGGQQAEAEAEETSAR